MKLRTATLTLLINRAVPCRYLQARLQAGETNTEELECSGLAYLKVNPLTLGNSHSLGTAE